MIREADAALKTRWRSRFNNLSAEARTALRDALLELRKDALEMANHQWRRHKGPMALYWKVVGVYAGHIARVLWQAYSNNELQSSHPGKYTN